jgi:hypothetical protein
MSHFFHVTSLPLRINQYSYQIKENDSYLIVETLSELVLPSNPTDSKAILLVNVSNYTIQLDSQDGINKIYNHLYSPDGTFNLKIEANRIIYLIYIVNYSTNEGRWVTHIG